MVQRAANYLASGRPVVVQETGFSDWMTTGEGVVPFTDLGEAVAAIEDVSARYEEHCRSAREIAAAYFNAKVVLGDLLDRAYSSRKGE